MGERKQNVEVEKLYESLKHKGIGADLARTLRQFYNDQQLPTEESGAINVQGRNEMWKVGARMSYGLRVGFCNYYFPDKDAVNITLEDGTIDWINADQPIRWEMVESTGRHFRMSTDSDE